MRREARPAAWCEHDHPKEVRVLGDGCSVRCLGCGQSGPVRRSIIAARKGLLATSFEFGSRATTPGWGSRAEGLGPF